MARAKIIAFSSLKGGVGKTTLTCLVSSWLHDNKKNVCVIDADEDQRTATLEVTKDDEKGLDTFTVIPSLSRDVASLIPEILEDYEYIFLDLPGNMDQKGIKSLYSMLDIVFIPFYPNAKDLDSAEKFYSILLEFQKPRLDVGQEKTEVWFCPYKTGKTKIGKDELHALFRNEYPLLENDIGHYDKIRDSEGAMNRMQKESYSHKIERFCVEVVNKIDKLEIKEY